MSWAPKEDEKIGAVRRAVYPSPRAGGGKALEPLKVELFGGDTEAIVGAR